MKSIHKRFTQELPEDILLLVLRLTSALKTSQVYLKRKKGTFKNSIKLHTTVQ